MPFGESWGMGAILVRPVAGQGIHRNPHESEEFPEIHQKYREITGIKQKNPGIMEFQGNPCLRACKSACKACVFQAKPWKWRNCMEISGNPKKSKEILENGRNSRKPTKGRGNHRESQKPTGMGEVGETPSPEPSKIAYKRMPFGGSWGMGAILVQPVAGQGIHRNPQESKAFPEIHQKYREITGNKQKPPK